MPHLGQILKKGGEFAFGIFPEGSGLSHPNTYLPVTHCPQHDREIWLREMVRRIVSQVWGLAPLEPVNSPPNIEPQVLEVGKTLIAKPENTRFTTAQQSLEQYRAWQTLI